MEYENAEVLLKKSDRRFVIKADGLATGKGIILPGTPEEAEKAVEMIMLSSKSGKSGETRVGIRNHIARVISSRWTRLPNVSRLTLRRDSRSHPQVYTSSMQALNELVVNQERQVAVSCPSQRLEKTLKEAVLAAYVGFENIHFEGMFYRRDIGARPQRRSSRDYGQAPILVGRLAGLIQRPRRAPPSTCDARLCCPGVTQYWAGHNLSPFRRCLQSLRDGSLPRPGKGACRVPRSPAGDVANVGTLKLAGADAVVTITPPFYSESEPTARAREMAANVKYAIGRAVGTVQRVVYVSSAGAHLEHGTGVVKTKYEAEQVLTGAAPEVVFVRRAYFMKNWKAALETLKAESSFFYSVLCPEDLKIPMICDGCDDW
ncbi:uncharacterized protein LY79DRAFT_577166 [Colletotrichum navitas]|uniref:Glycinamide ribonucleotide synthetase n=1 Tax=Colletotrichum navitas TaxID=681940 RepID=A0AAD8V9J7_9PEZI|nr:uncharacterized protein LY79DRAFT_577166 [Colletotrichum navitas]KAK1596585.1 hypothetical protein LY79DRAFT_577166 [Colletotrichum navitas]